jgi:nitroimidazol reductase NimA-like FMN-containing flavoprotein (pyridoxamine 5'-phosphate oxidase superfamily)
MLSVERLAGTEVLDVRASLALLRTRDVGRLAVVVNGHPDIFPVNFAFDRGRIMFRTAEGTKLSAILFGGPVAFEVDGYDASAGQAWSVVLKGPATEIKRPAEWTTASQLPLFPWHADPKPRFVRIDPLEITGRRFHVVDPDTWTVTESSSSLGRRSML